MKPFHVFYLIFIAPLVVFGVPEPVVVVVGAGLAGLTAAHRLHQQGVNVQVYEARSRVGGRVFTVKVGNQPVELGGQNIADGGEAENIRRLIHELGLELTDHRYSLNFCYFDGKAFTPQHLLHKREWNPATLQSELVDASQKSQNMRDLFDALFKDEDLLYKALSTRLAAYEGAPIENLSPLYTETLYHMLLGGVCAVHQNHFVEFASIQGGNDLLPEKLAQSLGKKVHLNMPLTAVSTDLDGYRLRFQDGQEVRADILVLAIPCSVYADIAFEKTLIPTERLSAIQKIQYGTNAKLLIPFSRFPERGGLVNDRAVSWLNADGSILTLYYTGETSRFTADTISETYSQEHRMLEMHFQDLCPAFAAPTLARDDLRVYEGPVGHSWPNDAYAKGSYSFIASGQETLLTSLQDEKGEVVKTLFAPIDQTLYFAGEHTSIHREILGTMEAACASGEAAARMILRALSF